MSSLIESNPDILNGKPIIKGTRIPVDLIFELIGANISIDEILEDYPSITRPVLIEIVKIGMSAKFNLKNLDEKHIFA
jgi:uncharacterized protein (DUF433 family)